MSIKNKIKIKTYFVKIGCMCCWFSYDRNEI